jgi:hypothetical protein
VEYKKFKSPDNKERYFTLDSGHAFRVYGEWIGLPEFAWTTAYSNGCISEDMIRNAALEGLPDAAIKSITNSANRDERIKAVILQWIKDDDMGKFTTAGLPNARKVSDELGIQATKGEVVKIFHKIQESAA